MYFYCDVSHRQYDVVLVPGSACFYHTFMAIQLWRKLQGEAPQL